MIRRVFLAFLVFGLVACGDDGVGPEDIVGTYVLQSIDGEALPVAVLLGTTLLFEVTAGSVTLDPDMTCRINISIRETEDGPVSTNTTVCTYTFNNGALTVNVPADADTNAGTIRGSIVGSRLALNDEGSILVYEK